MIRWIPPIAVRGSAGPRAGRGRGIVRLVSLLLFVLVVGGPAAIAQEDSNAEYWLRERALERALHPPAPHPRVIQRPTHLIRRAPPVRGFAREVPATARPAPAQGTLTATPQTVSPQTVAPATTTTASSTPASGTFVVAVMGDSLGQLLARGLSEAFADKPEVVILHKARENTGLVRDDYFDWVKAVRDLLAGPDKIGVGVMMIGSNDRQPIREGTTTVELHTPRWKALYAARVEAIADMFRDKKIPLIWVGLPIMKSERLSADMAAFNEIYRESAGKAGATYIDTWAAFADDRGQYATYGPDINGQFVKIRSGDGVHFTRAGARTLAHFVEDDIRRDEQKALPPLNSAIAALESPAGASGSGETSQRQTTGWLAGLPVPALPPAVVIPIKPAAGPIVPLNAPPVSPDGRLATLTDTPTATTDAQALLDKALVEGRPLGARRGRADDFKWPRD